MGEKILTVNHLQVSFQTIGGEVKAVRDVHFDLEAGETLAVVGESGCGKTVMVKSLLRLHDSTNAVIAPESEILFDGRDVGKLSRKELQQLRGRDIAMIFQDSMTSLNPTSSVGTQIMEALKIHTDLNRDARRERAIELLKMVEMPDAERRMRAYPHQLSGGMRQRVMIAMALACNPRILLADEPTTALDVTIQAQLLDLLAELKEKLHMAIILVTHDLNIVLDFADRIQVMYAGSILERGTRAEIAGNPLHPYTWALLQAMPGEYMKPKSSLYTIGGTPPDLRLELKQCPFAARCPYCMNICRRERPQETELSETHSVACWLRHPLAPAVESPFGGSEHA